MIRRVASISALLATVLVAGCSASPDDPAPPKAPRLTELVPMTGAIHVTWVNEEPACDTVEIERKSGSAAFAVVYSVPGAADNKHDASATDRITYSYRLRCKKGGAYSPYSNQLDGTPG